ncbi:MAG: ABC transporter ATP-binding protein [Alphaproteobacteria bacterium]|nr:ABC transporter ATP-binding protein [Alphaproteobacteria bacterium]
MSNDILLDVHNLRVSFGPEETRLVPVDGVSFHLKKGETLGIVGESGSGKSTLGMALMRLAPAAQNAMIEGSIKLQGRELMGLGADEMRAIRGHSMAMILQDPMTSLNPVRLLGDQVGEVISAHQRISRESLNNLVLKAFNSVRIASPAHRINAYPHQISGGMRQRIVGAAAIIGHPDVLIADEPTTSLDVTIQAQYLDLLRDLQLEIGMGMIFITHDFGVVAKMCDRVAVIYAGQIVETARVRDLFHTPRHWYTAALMACIPKLQGEAKRLATIEGQPPRLVSRAIDPPAACRFAQRCPAADIVCEQAPPETQLANGAMVRCWHPREAS